MSEGYDPEKAHRWKSKDELISEIKRLNGIIARQGTVIKKQTRQGKNNPFDVLKTEFVCYEPHEIKRIMTMLGEKPPVFCERFNVSLDTVKAWITPRLNKHGKKSSKHAECLGLAGKFMYWAAVEANSKCSAKGNLIRLAMRK